MREVRQLVLDLDNGPENGRGSRGRWLVRMALLARKYQWTVVLVYYPPYHSKYNPIERLWGILENYSHRELLDSEAAILGYAGQQPTTGCIPRCDAAASSTPKG